MSNRIAAAHQALEDALRGPFEAAGTRVFRNPDGMRHFESGSAVLSINDDEAVETVRVLSGPIYDLMAEPLITLARKTDEASRREAAWVDADRVRDLLAADPTLGGVVEDARVTAVESAELDRSKWIAGGLDLTVRLLFAAPSAAG